MKQILTTIVLLLSAIPVCLATADYKTIAAGQQPQITIDDLGTIRIIYGDNDKIYCATSTNNGISFPEIRLVGEVPGMHLGMSRGPQAATSKNYTLVSAIDKKGTIHIFQLYHSSGKWTAQQPANDAAGSAPEGLMSLAADENDNFYAVWLDIRNDKQNKICFSKTTDKGISWTRNKIVYASPDKTVCGCCKPSVAVSQAELCIMFRNWLHGSRDLYLLTSHNKGITFDKPRKLGYGTWKLNGCPMDGGGLAMNKKNGIFTVWQREGSVYFSRPNEREERVDTGRSCNISVSGHPIITWQDGKKLKLEQLNKKGIINIGEGSFVKAIRTRNDKIFCAWENNGKIIFTLITA